MTVRSGRGSFSEMQSRFAAHSWRRTRWRGYSGILRGFLIWAPLVWGTAYNSAMVTKSVNDDENPHEVFLSANRKWKEGKGKNWFYPRADGAHVRLFWDNTAKPCLEYSDGGGGTFSMIKSGRKLDHYAYGIEQLKDKLDDDFSMKVVNEMVVAMRNWPKSRPSKPV